MSAFETLLLHAAAIAVIVASALLFRWLWVTEVPRLKREFAHALAFFDRGWDRTPPWLRRGRWVAYFIVLLSIVLAPMAYAQSGTVVDGVLDQTLVDMQGSIATWEDGIRSSLRTLFYYAALIEFAFALLMFMIKGRGDGQDLGALLIRQVVVISAFGALFELGPSLMGVLIEGLARVGQVGGDTGRLTPSGVLTVGLDTMFLMNEQIASAAWWKRQSGLGLAGFLLSVTVMMLFVWMAFQLLLLLLQAYMVMIAGLVFIAFGVNRLFRFTVQGYISYAFSTGVQLMFLYLILGLAMNAAQAVVPTIMGEGSLDGLLDRMMLATGIVFLLALLVHKVPSLAASAISGAPNLSAGDALAAGVAGGAVALGAGAAAATGVGAAAGAAKGAVQAAVAGTELAQAAGATGLKALAQGMGHAARATSSEAVAGLRSKVGMAPKSPNAVDSRGREVSNLGTRAANRLQTEKQGLLERGVAGAPPAAAGNPATTQPPASPTPPSPAGSQGAPAGGASDSAIAAPQPFGEQAPISSASESKHDASDSPRQPRRVPPPPWPGDAAPPATAPAGSEGLAHRAAERALPPESAQGMPYEDAKGASVREALNKLQAPNLPSDQAPGAGGTIQIQLDSRDD